MSEKTCKYSLFVNDEIVTGTVIVDSNDGDEEIKMAILDDVFSITYFLEDE